ncbi:hypothetical protein EBR66_03980 [bacterium]|nr:hypothetical protein [bacterium]
MRKGVQHTRGKKTPGKLIVLDGSDGVGKSTQTKLLLDRLKKEKVKVQTLDFPQYSEHFFGKLLGDCLSGKHGDFIGVDPYIVSVLYAADRWESKAKLESWLSSGTNVILNRYVSSNQMHQGGKIADLKKRKEFLNWLDTLEHKIFALPRPEIIFYLNLPVELSLRLLAERSEKEKRKYIALGSLDQAESNVKHLADTQKSALAIIQKNSTWKKIDCANEQGILPREVIHERLYSHVSKIIRI